MLFIPGRIVALLTFPGVIVHEVSHKLFCDLLGVKVREVVYFRWGNPTGYVVHDVPREFYKMFLIDVAPFVINTLFAVLLFIIARLLRSTEVLLFFFVWLGLSLAMNAFPSSTDATALWKASRSHVAQGHWAALVGLPFSVILWTANILSVVWFDFFYGFALYYLAFFIIG